MTERRIIDQLRQRTQPDAQGAAEAFSQPLPGGAKATDDEWFYAVIDGNAAAPAPTLNRWVYAWTEVLKSAEGYGGWTARPGGRSGTTAVNPARNFVEDPGSASAIRPVSNGVIVRMREVRFAVAGVGYVEYWFTGPPLMPGTCCAECPSDCGICADALNASLEGLAGDDCCEALNGDYTLTRAGCVWTYSSGPGHDFGNGVTGSLSITIECDPINNEWVKTTVVNVAKAGPVCAIAETWQASIPAKQCPTGIYDISAETCGGQVVVS